MDSVRNATFRIGFPPPYVSLRSIRCKSLDRHMAASSILKWQNSLQRASRLVDTMRLLFILKWQYSLCVIIAHMGVFIGVRSYVFY